MIISLQFRAIFQSTVCSFPIVLFNLKEFKSLVDGQVKLTGFADHFQFTGDIPFVLIGNKLDLVPEVGEVIDRDECREYAEDEGSIYIETSAKDGTNVVEAFIELTRLIVAKSEGN